MSQRSRGAEGEAPGVSPICFMACEQALCVTFWALFSEFP